MILQHSSFKARLPQLLFFSLIIILQLSCTKTGSGIKGSEVRFTETGNDAPEQITRMLVTKKYLRIDDGSNGSDFLLFDRAEKTIYSTNSTDQRTLVIYAHSLTAKSPVKLENKIDMLATDAPEIDGHRVYHYKLLTNNKTCYDLFAAEGLLPDVVAALIEYRNALAGEQAVIIDAIPKDMLLPCDLANNIFMATRHLEHGFPVRLQETGGKFRELIDYKQDISIDGALLKLPEGYENFTAEDMRSR